MPYAPITYTITSGQVSTPEFNYAAIPLSTSDTINHLDQLKVSLNGSVLTPTTDYTVVEGTTTMTVSATLAEDDILLIERETDIDTARVTYANNALIDKDNLNSNQEQILFRLQEQDSDIGNAITLDLSNGCWDGQGYPTCDFAPATVSSGLTTLSQVQSLVAGVDIATVDNIYEMKASGDGVTTVFALTGFPKTGISNAAVMIDIDGVTQYPGASFDYTYALSGSIPTVTFTTAPPSGTNNILFRTYKGTVQTTYADSSVDGDAIITGSMPVTKLEAAAGVANRFITFNTSGVASIGTIAHTQISDFDTGVRQNRTNEMTAPNGSVGFNNQKLINLGTGAASSSDACTVAQMEAYADAAVGVAGSDSFMEPYDTDSSAKFTSNLTAQTVTGRTAGTYFVTVHCDGAAGSPTVSVGGITREAVGSGPSVSFVVTTAGTTLSFTSSGCNMRNITGFRLS